MAEEQPVDVNGIIKARMMSDGQNHSNNSQNFVALLNNATVLAIPRAALPGTIGGLNVASHVPESNPFPAPK